MRPSATPTGRARARLRTGELGPVLRCVLLLAVGTACGQAPESETGETEPPVKPAAVAGFVGAVYHTSLTFVGFRGEPPILHLRFENRTGPRALRLEYDGWLTTSDTWIPVLSLVDSLAVPRAAWRVLPVGPLRVKVGEFAELASLVLDTPPRELRLNGAAEIAAWNSATGQRETLRLAEFVARGAPAAGLLLARQRARLSSDEPPELLSQFFVLADTLGNGLLVLRDTALPVAPATAWTWLDGTEAEWPDAVVVALAAPQGAAGRWSLELPGAGIMAEIEGASTELGELPDEGAGFRAFRVAGTLIIEERRRAVRGVGVEERGP